MFGVLNFVHFCREAPCGVFIQKEKGIGYNAATDEWVNMIEAGIVDPTKVTRSALQNAASVSALLLTTEAVVADKPAPVAPPMPGMDPGMGMM